MSVKLFVMDVDGTLTDGKIYIGASGEIMKAFDVKDGYAIVHLRDYNIVPAIITGRKSDIVEKRAAELGITELHQGVSDKLAVLKQLGDKYNCKAQEIAYIGDDLNDITCIEYVGFSGCPSDAADEIKNVVSYVCSNKGGSGAVREFVMDIIQKLFDK